MDLLDFPDNHVIDFPDPDMSIMSNIHKQIGFLNSVGLLVLMVHVMFYSLYFNSPVIYDDDTQVYLIREITRGRCTITLCNILSPSREGLKQLNQVIM